MARVLSLNHKSSHTSFLHLAFQCKLAHDYKGSVAICSLPSSHMATHKSSPVPSIACSHELAGAQHFSPGIPFPNSLPGGTHIHPSRLQHLHHLDDAWRTMPLLPLLPQQLNGSLLCDPNHLTLISIVFLAIRCNSSLANCLANPLWDRHHLYL